jgi:alcohol dehydrogenase class IV
MEATRNPWSGLYQPQNLEKLYYGRGVVSEKLLSCLPSPSSRVFIITGTSLASKTPLVKQVEGLLSSHHAGTFSGIRQHAPIAQLWQALKQIQADDTIDTVVSIGGGSPIDSAKSIIYHHHQASGKWLAQIAIPTTLSASECTHVAGTTTEEGVKTGVQHPNIYPSSILYDPTFALYTPTNLFLSTGIRALDHAVELQYSPTATWMPCQILALHAIRELFELLPKYKSDPSDEDVIVRLFLAAYASLGFLGRNMKGSIGLTHTIGYALGSPYGIPHGVTSCLSLSRVVKLKAKMNEGDAKRIAAILPFLNELMSDDPVKDSEKVGDRIEELVASLGLATTLTEQKIGKDQVDVICSRATAAWMPSEQKQEQNSDFLEAVRSLILNLY